MTTQIIFVDTNSFIQLIDLKDIPWGDLFPGVRQITIMVARPVIEELDEFKTSTNDRRRNRARLALKLIDSASQADGRSLILKAKPKVTLAIAPRRTIDWEAHPDMDRASPDDRLVMAAAAFGEDAVVLSHDSGPRISARDIGVTAYRPLDAWLLPVEQSDDQRIVAKLKQQLKEANNKQPSIEIAFHHVDDDGIIQLRCPVVPPLDRSAIERLRSAYLERQPRAEIQATVFPNGYSQRIMAPPHYDQDDVAEYFEQYRKFQDRVSTYFDRFNEHISRICSAPDVQYDLINTGNASAMQLVVDICVEGPISILADTTAVQNVMGELNLPPAPSIPAKRGMDHLFQPSPMAMPVTMGLNPGARQQADPTELRWTEIPKPGDQVGRYTCQDFRPKRTYVDRLWLWPRGKRPITGTLTVMASANHLATVTKTATISIMNSDAGWDSDLVAELVPDYLLAAIRG